MTSIKRLVGEAGDPLWNHDAGQGVAMAKSLGADFRHAGRNVHVGEHTTEIKCGIADAGDAVRNGHMCQRGATRKDAVAQLSQSVWQGDFRQPRT